MIHNVQAKYEPIFPNSKLLEFIFQWHNHQLYNSLFIKRRLGYSKKIGTSRLFAMHSQVKLGHSFFFTRLLTPVMGHRDNLKTNSKAIYYSLVFNTPYSFIAHYGNTGCQVFKQCVQNWKDFCLKINIQEGNYWILWIGLMRASEVFKNQSF